MLVRVHTCCFRSTVSVLERSVLSNMLRRLVRMFEARWNVLVLVGYARTRPFEGVLYVFMVSARTLLYCKLLCCVVCACARRAHRAFS